MHDLFTMPLAESIFAKWWLREPSSNIGDVDTDGMAMWLWWFCTVWFVGLMLLMFYWVVKYRRRAGKIAPRSAAHNAPLEIVWTIVPSLFLVYIFLRGFQGWASKVIAPGDAIQMNFVGAKWYWSLQYPTGVESPSTTKIGAKDVPVFYLPAERSIKLKMHSLDVMHAFWVPDFRVKQDLWPNRYSQVWFQPKTPPEDSPRHPTVTPDSPDEVAKALSGVPYKDHWLFCAEYCGDEHSEMAAVIRVVPEDAYNRWLLAIANAGTPVENGQRIWKTRCSSCHTVDGGKNTGPTWLNLWATTNHEMSDGTIVTVNHDYVRESILTPQKHIVKGFEGQNMTSFAGILKDSDIDNVIEYMKTLSKNSLPDEKK